MLLPKLLLFTLATGQIGVVTVLVIYSMLTLLKMRSGELTAEQGCATLNTLLPIAVLIHGCSALVLMIHGHWLLFTLDLIILRWTVPVVVKNRNKGVFVARNILNAGQIGKYIRSYYIFLVYLAMCISIYAKRVIEGLNTPMNCGPFGCRKSLLFVSTISLAEAMLSILVYSLVALSNIEQYGSCARKMCKNMNRLLVVRVIIHGAFSCILTAHTSWAFFFSNLQILCCEIYKIADVYNPMNILLPAEIYRHRSYNRTCLFYFCAYLGIYTYCLLVGRISVVASKLLLFLPMLLMELHDMLTDEWRISSVSRFFFYFFTDDLRDRLHNNAHLLMYVLEGYAVIIYWAYLAVWKDDWTVKRGVNWVMNIFYDTAVVICLTLAGPVIERNRV